MPQPGPTMTAQQVGQPGARALDAGRHQPRGDDRGLQQAQVVAAEVEHLVELAHLRRGLEVDAGEAEHRLVDHAEIGLDRRARLGIAAVHAEVDGDVEHARALGKIHAEEEDVAPAAVGEVHAHRGALAQDGMGRVAAAARAAARAAPAAAGRAGGRGGTSRQLPRVARTVWRTWSASVWKPSAWYAAASALDSVSLAPCGGLRAQEPADGLLEAPFQHAAEAVVGHAARAGKLGPRRQVITMDRREEEQCADAPVEVGLAPAVARRVRRTRPAARRPAGRRTSVRPRGRAPPAPPPR